MQLQARPSPKPFSKSSWLVTGAEECPLRLGVYVYKAGEVALKDTSNCAERHSLEESEPASSPVPACPPKLESQTPCQ